MYKPDLPANVDSLRWVGYDDPAYAESGLIHCVRIPEDASRARPAPLVVMLHGWGGDETSMWFFKRILPAGVAVVTPRAPLALDDMGFFWFTYGDVRQIPITGSLQLALDGLRDFLAALPRFYPVDPTRLVLIGFSQGAALSCTYVVVQPNAAIGLAVLAGSMPKFGDGDLHPTLLAGLPIFIAHGKRDDIVPPELARQTQEFFTGLGADVSYHEYQTGHKMNEYGMKDLKAWLRWLLGTF